MGEIVPTMGQGVYIKCAWKEHPNLKTNLQFIEYMTHGFLGGGEGKGGNFHSLKIVATPFKKPVPLNFQESSFSP